MSCQFRDTVEKMAGYVPGFQPADPAAIKINTNENPYPPSPRVFEALRGLTALDLCRYPSILWKEFRRAAAELYGVGEDMIACGNGGDELLAYIVRCCCDSRRPLAYPVPTYTLYPTLAELQDAPVIEIPFGDDFSIPPALYSTRAPLTILCNPNAPSCTFVDPERVDHLARHINGILLVDEAYVDFAGADCLALVKKYDHVAVLRSMSKSYSLAGMRFGYLIGSPRIIEAIIKVKDSYNVNVATQAAALAALRDQNYFRDNVRKVKEQRRRLIDGLRALGFAVAESHTNFVLATIPAGSSAETIYTRLTEKNIFVRHFNQPGLRDKLRISVGSAPQVDALLAALQMMIKP